MLRSKTTRFVKNDHNDEQLIGHRLRSALLKETGLSELVLEGEHSGTMAEQEGRPNTLSDYAKPRLIRWVLLL